MPLADFTAIDAMWICLSVFLVVVAVALAYLLVRLAGTAGRLTSFLGGLETSVIPLLDKSSESLDHVNKQLEKVDKVTDSAVDAADKADTAVRAVSMAITAPVTKVSGLAKGVSHGTSAFMAGNSLKSSLAAGRDAAHRREQEIGEEFARVDQRAAEAAAGGGHTESAPGEAADAPAREGSGSGPLPGSAPLAPEEASTHDPDGPRSAG